VSLGHPLAVCIVALMRAIEEGGLASLERLGLVEVGLSGERGGSISVKDRRVVASKSAACRTCLLGDRQSGCDHSAPS
jgi:hypothetical protein